MNSKEITICLTSCARFDLLERTIKSLVEFWDGPIPKAFLIYEDQDLCLEPIQTFWNGMNSLIYSLNNDWPMVELSWGKIGQIRVIDTMYSKSKTSYIFHCEDDWRFSRTGFIEKSMSILEERPDIMQVWIRNPNDRNGHPAIGQVHKTSNGVKYQMMRTGYRHDWHGFSFNPGLRRLSDYKKLFPNGYADAVSDKMNGLKSEAEIGKIYMQNGFRAATLLEGYCTHIGKGRHVK